MSRKIDLLGQRFDRLVVIAEAPKLPPSAFARWLCRCDCGNEKEASGQHLRSGNIRSCGCLIKESASKLMKKMLADRVTHKEASRGHVTTEYQIWSGMNKRCTNPKTIRWARYGGRGISVCDRWSNSYENFLADMGRRPSNKHSIDRIDNDGNYEPCNCRWATILEQANNKKTNIKINYKGQSMTIRDAVNMTGFSYDAIKNRLSLGWTDEETIETPLRPRGKALSQSPLKT